MRFTLFYVLTDNVLICIKELCEKSNFPCLHEKNKKTNYVIIQNCLPHFDWISISFHIPLSKKISHKETFDFFRKKYFLCFYNNISLNYKYSRNNIIFISPPRAKQKKNHILPPKIYTFYHRNIHILPPNLRKGRRDTLNIYIGSNNHLLLQNIRILPPKIYTFYHW